MVSSGPKARKLRLSALSLNTSRTYAPSSIISWPSTRAGGRYVERIVAEVRQAQVAQQQTAVGVRVGADAVVALGREFAQLGNQAAVLVEQLFRVVAAQPVVQNLQVLGLIHHDRHLMRAEAALDLLAVHHLGAGPALGGAQHDHRPDRTGGVAGLACVLLNGEDFLDDLVERLGHLAVHGHRIVALDEIRLPAAALKILLQLLVRNAGEDGRVGDLVE